MKLTPAQEAALAVLQANKGTWVRTGRKSDPDGPTVNANAADALAWRAHRNMRKPDPWVVTVRCDPKHGFIYQLQDGGPYQ